MQTFDQMLAWLRSRHPTVGETEAMTVIALAYRDLASEFKWSFLLAETAIQTEAPFTSGTVAVTNGSTAVVLTGDVWVTGWTNRRIVISGRTESYIVQTIGTTTTLTLAQPWAGATGSGLSYTMYRSAYGMPVDCDYGRDVIFWNASADCQQPMISQYDMKIAAAYMQGQVGTPEAIARGQIIVDNAGNPIEYVELGPTAPGAVYVYPAFYFRKVPPPTGTGYPVWPEDFQDLIPRSAEIELEQNPRHRIVLNPETKQKYYRRLWSLKLRNDGGAEIARRIQRYRGDRWSAFFRNVNFTASGFNPLTGA